LRAEIARDKEIRRLNQGVIPSVLGVDGYNPSAIQYDAAGPPAAPEAAAVAAPTPLPSKPPAPVSSSNEPAVKKQSTAKPSTVTPIVDPEKKISFAIQLLLKYRTGGDGGNALKLLVTFLKNIVENPEEPK
jgi:hypothetical protein